MVVVDYDFCSMLLLYYSGVHLLIIIIELEPTAVYVSTYSTQLYRESFSCSNNNKRVT